MKYILKNKGKGTHGGVNPVSVNDLYRLDTPEVLTLTDIDTRSYNDLQDLPIIPSTTEELTNDSGFITGLTWDQVTGKPTLNIANWNTAYGWGDHASEGYIKSYVNTTYTNGTGLNLVGTTFSVKYGTTSGTAAQGNDNRIVNGNTAFGWGNHSTQGYLKSYTDTNTTYSAGTGLDLNSTTFSVEFGTTTGTVAAGNDSRITNGATAHSWGNHNLYGYITGLSWSQLTGKPTTFTPSAHTHVKADITDFPTNVSSFTNDSGYVTGLTWSQVTGKPTTFTPSAHNHDDRYYTETEIDVMLSGAAVEGHTHVVADITDFPIIPSTTSELTNNSGYITGVSWSEVTGKPAIPDTTSDLVNDSGFITGVAWGEITSKPTLDNYVSWNLKTNGVQRTTVGSNGILDLVAGNNITLSYAAGGQVTISATTVEGADGNNYPTSLDFNTTNGIFTVGRNGLANLTVDLDGRYSLLGHIHSYNDLTNKPVIPTVPTNVSAFTNDAGYLTSVSVPTTTSELTNDSGFITSGALPTNVSELTNDSNYITLAEVPAPIEGTADISSSRSLTAADKGKTLICSGTISITIPTGLGTNFSVNLINDGAGVITLVQGSGTNLKAPHGLKIGSDDCANILKRTSAETFYIQGTLTV